MSHRLRVACQLGVIASMGASTVVDLIPPVIGVPLLMISCVLSYMDVAFHIHDRNQLREDTASLDLHK